MGLKGTFTDLGASVSIAAQVMADLAPKISTVADATKKLADAEKQLATDIQYAKDQTLLHKRAMEDSVESMTKAANAAADFRSKLEALSEAQSHSATTTQAGIQVSGAAQIIQIQTIRATQEQTDALIELLKAQNAYSDSVAKTLDVAKGWSDYLAILADSYKNGTTSLLAYRQALEMFKTQLQQTFVGATGEAKKALEEMIATIQKLIATAGQGPAPSTDQSPSGALDRTFNK